MVRAVEAEGSGGEEGPAQGQQAASICWGRGRCASKGGRRRSAEERTEGKAVVMVGESEDVRRGRVARKRDGGCESMLEKRFAGAGPEIRVGVARHS